MIRRGVVIAGYRKSVVSVNRTVYHGYFGFLRLETGFELSSSSVNVSCFGSNRNRSSLFFYENFSVDLAYNFKIAGSKVLDDYYNSYLKR
jgi:hypothetical protein